MNSNNEHLRSSCLIQCCLFGFMMLKVEQTKQNTSGEIQDQQNESLPSLVKQPFLFLNTLSFPQTIQHTWAQLGRRI